ncbi:DUF202 domain-containing protein [Kocuria palustris]|jgi:putative membrane protein|uniref:YidH family protein n=1 Tax=Kocuria TaxID=57493 RepID=UPI00195A4AF8|nr:MULTISPECIES: DUF202 domain-containing protein [Kocuria]MBM7822828.1 putative membrane protein [Kocuria palustris]MBN6753174.1 DUF202 domain-containing protein [Kocuria palustris]MBN6758391.1 DUF202 domain-containing protein [Kocuria palustris]MBN6763479.1 DUF202 domain-containing protein [Kocuria palustris]MBN6782679.1 DUF202 domain-containing protein [Kocuria palustris]
MNRTPRPSGETGRSPFAARLLGGGGEPDPRFTLANERTFLAWIRTALGLLAGGIALEAFAGDLIPQTVRVVLAAGLIALSMVVAISASVRWLRVERAMRRRAPLPLAIMAPVLSLGAALAAGVLLGVLIGR